MPSHRLTILSSMAGAEFEQALDRHVEWGLRTVDLKDRIWDKSVTQLTDAEAERAAELLATLGLSVTCLSTTFFGAEAEAGEDTFRRHLAGVERTVEIARILQPQFIRLLAAGTERREELANSIGFLSDRHPWLFDLYREAVDCISDGGFVPTVENEVGRCLMSTPVEITGFFEVLDRPSATFTWDVQNLWQMGTFPTLEVYEAVKPLVGYFHVKGGQSGPDGRMTWRSSLEDADWPVLDIVRQVVADGVSPVICLNPPHGGHRPGAPEESYTLMDIEFLRRMIPEIE